MALSKQINLRLDGTDQAALKSIAENQGRSEQDVLRQSFRQYAKDFQDQMNFFQSVERGWMELNSGLGETHPPSTPHKSIFTTESQRKNER